MYLDHGYYSKDVLLYVKFAHSCPQCPPDQTPGISKHYIGMPSFLHRFAFGRNAPVAFELMPSTHWLFAHFKLADHHIVVTIFGQYTLADVAPHGDINQYPKVLHAPDALRYARLLHRPPIDIPYHAPSPVGDTFLFYPCKPVCVRPMRQVVQWRSNDLVLVMIFGIVVTPMQARVIDALALPALADIHLAIVRPLERILGQQPICRPHALGTRRQDGSSEVAARPRQRLVRRQTRRGIRSVLDETAHDQAVVVVERVGSIIGVVLLLVVAPAVVALLVSKIVRYGRVGIEGR